MKNIFCKVLKQGLLLLICLAVVFSLVGCGVSKKEYQAIVSERDKLQEEYNELKSNYDKLLSDTADWKKLTEDEKKIKIAESETERIKAEEELQKVTAEQEARKAAEEQAAREAASVTLSMGKYSVPADFKPGKYDVYVVSGMGNFQGNKVNEILGRETMKYSNFIVEDGDYFSIKGSLILRFEPK